MAQGKKGISKKALLKMINDTLRSLETEMEFRKLPPRIPGCEILEDRTIVMVDDTVELLMFFAAPLMMETGGKAHFILHKRKSLVQLLEVVLEKNPNIVLIDGLLAEDIKGYDLVALIKKERPEVLCIGFPAGPEFNKKFMVAGSEGVVIKRLDNPEEVIRQIAEIVRRTSKGAL